MLSDSELQDSLVKVPKHIAIIMDGNGRWAKARGLPKIAGHRKGVEAVKIATQTCIELGVQHLTLYAFSSENWKRPTQEISDLMSLLRRYVRREVNDINANGIKLRFIGDKSRMSMDVQQTLIEAENKTVNNDKLILTVAVNYGGRQEILQATKNLVTAVNTGKMCVDDITEITFESELQTFDMPSPDLLIRTSGEQRLSNFLLWQSAYTELSFTDTFWPDFSEYSLRSAIKDYNNRERRYGGSGK